MKNEWIYLLVKWPGTNIWEKEYQSKSEDVINKKREILEQELINANDEESDIAILNETQIKREKKQGRKFRL